MKGVHQGPYRSPVTRRLVIAMTAAVVLHACLFLVPKFQIIPQVRIDRPIQVELTQLLPEPAPETPEPDPVEELPEPEPPPEPVPDPEPLPEPPVLPEPAEPEPLIAESPPPEEPVNEPTAAEILSQLQKYQLEDKITLPPGTLDQPKTTFQLGEFQGGNLLADLDRPLPKLPFEDRHTAFDEAGFYANGVKGDFQRFFDKITPEYEFTTKYGTKVKCIFLVVSFVCGWD